LRPTEANNTLYEGIKPAHSVKQLYAKAEIP